LESHGDGAVHGAIAELAAGKLIGDGLKEWIAVGRRQRGGGADDRQRLVFRKTDRHGGPHLARRRQGALR
jgi:hypothetical protein